MKEIYSVSHTMKERKKQLKDCNDLLDMVKELGMSRSTINFEINLIKLLDKFPRLKKFSLSLHFLKIAQRA